jgi:hypothetical protein
MQPNVPVLYFFLISGQETESFFQIFKFFYLCQVLFENDLLEIILI